MPTGTTLFPIRDQASSKLPAEQKKQARKSHDEGRVWIRVRLATSRYTDGSLLKRSSHHHGLGLNIKTMDLESLFSQVGQVPTCAAPAINRDVGQLMQAGCCQREFCRLLDEWAGLAIARAFVVGVLSCSHSELSLFRTGTVETQASRPVRQLPVRAFAGAHGIDGPCPGSIGCWRSGSS